MTGSPITATLDTNLLFEYWKRQDNAAIVEKLLRLSGEGRVDLAVTTRISADIPWSPLAERIKDLPMLGIDRVGTAFRIGVSPLGGRDMIVGAEYAGLESFFKGQGAGKHRPDWRDQDHLYGHLVAGRAVFLTWDKGILRLAAGLRERFRIVVMRPQTFVACFPNTDDGPPE